MEKRTGLWISLAILIFLAIIIATGKNLNPWGMCGLVGNIKMLECTDFRWGWSFQKEVDDSIQLDQIYFVNFHHLYQDCDEEDPTWGYITREYRQFGVEIWRHTADGQGISHFFGLDMFGYYDRVDAPCPAH